MRIEVAPGRRLFVDIEGPQWVVDGACLREKPTLIVLHGGPGYDHSSFKPAFSALAEVAQIIYVDHRGHGRSDRCPSEEWTLDTFADDVVRLSDALGLVKPMVLGQSFGGFVAQRYLACHPAHAARVVLSSTSHHFGLERKLAMFERLGGAGARQVAQAFWSEPNVSTWADYQRLCNPLYNTTPGDPRARQRTVFNDDILFHWVRGEQREMKLLPGLSAVRCPVLVLAGEQDPVTPLQDAQDIAAAIPAPWGRLVSIAGAGHGTWRDRPEQAMAVLREFIAASA